MLELDCITKANKAGCHADVMLQQYLREVVNLLMIQLANDQQKLMVKLYHPNQQ